jgi:hypothetical protein
VVYLYLDRLQGWLRRGTRTSPQQDELTVVAAE